MSVLFQDKAKEVGGAHLQPKHWGGKAIQISTFQDGQGYGGAVFRTKQNKTDRQPHVAQTALKLSLDLSFLPNSICPTNAGIRGKCFGAWLGMHAG